MNKLALFLFGIILLISCNTEKNTENSTAEEFDFSYTIDTVQVDAGDEFLFLKYGLYTSGVSTDKKYFYNFDELGSKLEVIDLEQMVLKEKIPIDREGPNGIGTEHVSKLQGLENGNISFYNIRQITIVSPAMERVSQHSFYPELLEGDTLPEKAEIPAMYGHLNLEGSLYGGFYSLFFENETLGIALLELTTNKLQLIPTDKLDYLKDLIFTYSFGNAIMNSGDLKFIDFYEDKLIISTSGKNEVLIYDTEIDSLYSISYHSSITSDIKKGSYKSESDSDLALKLKDLEVNFGPLVFDESNGVFWRYSRESISNNSENPSYTYVLTAFDKDFNQMHEEKLDVNWTKMPSIKFIKEGMLYTYINLEDELAFMRLKPTFTNE